MLNKIAIVQCYINNLKGIEVEINPPRNLKEVMLLDLMYNKAILNVWQ